MVDKGMGHTPAPPAAATERIPYARFYPRWLEWLSYALLDVVLGTGARFHFRRIEVAGLEHLPSRGGVLLLTNHPAAWTDVLVLGVALPRRLHFVAHAMLLRPWPRGLVVRLSGALPIYLRDEAEAAARNQATFEACQRLLKRGEVVAMFPEGVSSTDRRVQPLKTGAARIALAHCTHQETPPVVVPVGIHYTDRTRPWSDVLVSLARPVDLSPFRDLARRDPTRAMHELTATFHRALTGLVVHVREPRLESIVRELEPLLDERGLRVTSLAGLQRVQSAARQVEWLWRTDRPRLVRLWRRARRLRRRLAALGLPAGRPDPLPGGIARARIVLIALVGALPALAGALLHIVPASASEWIARRLAPQPNRMSFARIVASAVLVPVTYVCLAWVGLARGIAHWWIAVGVLLAPWLGGWASWYREWLGIQLGRVRLARTAASGLVRQLAAEHDELTGMLLAPTRCNGDTTAIEAP